MDVLTALDNRSDYSRSQLQLIVGAWIASAFWPGRSRISLSDGDVDERDYDKRSVYSLLYALYRSMGEVRDEHGNRYEFTFNTWGYSWPDGWGAPPNSGDPQQFGRNAYSGLFHFPQLHGRAAELSRPLRIVELGCGTGAGAHHVCTNVLKTCEYEAVDMQEAAIRTCRRKFVPELKGRLRAVCADASTMERPPETADVVAVNETHVTEWGGFLTDEDRRFFRTAHRLLTPGGFLTWGNAIPDATWAPSFEFLRSIGMELVEEHDVTKLAVQARDEDQARIDLYVEQCIEAFPTFRAPLVGARRASEARVALKNFARNPGTRLYQNMVDRTDTYRVVLFQKAA
jgi:ubiquinone/menaquinone biosynthesis C-methylase UbiE